MNIVVVHSKRRLSDDPIFLNRGYSFPFSLDNENILNYPLPKNKLNDLRGISDKARLTIPLTEATWGL